MDRGSVFGFWLLKVVEMDVEIDPIRTVLGSGEGMEAALERSEAVVGQDLQYELQFSRVRV